jgi:hypothetical protein
MLSDKFTEITKQNGLYNIQAISNISSIMEKGILSYEKAGGILILGILCYQKDVIKITRYVY